MVSNRSSLSGGPAAFFRPDLIPIASGKSISGVMENDANGAGVDCLLNSPLLPSHADAAPQSVSGGISQPVKARVRLRGETWVLT